MPGHSKRLSAQRDILEDGRLVEVESHVLDEAAKRRAWNARPRIPRYLHQRRIRRDSSMHDWIFIACHIPTTDGINEKKMVGCVKRRAAACSKRLDVGDIWIETKCCQVSIDRSVSDRQRRVESQWPAVEHDSSLPRSRPVVTTLNPQALEMSAWQRLLSTRPSARRHQSRIIRASGRSSGIKLQRKTDVCSNVMYVKLPIA
jgi:hypothetical protein